MAHSDKRKVSTDALETLGSLIDENEKRDAIHLAVIPVVAKQRLTPGQDVGHDGTTDNPVGIVDPFLKEKFINPGDRFWLVIYPRQITSLRHVWTHPAFPEQEVGVVNEDNYVEAATIETEEFRKSKEYIEEVAKNLRISYKDLMKSAHKYISDGDLVEVRTLASFDESSGDFPLWWDQDFGAVGAGDFWIHYEILTGEKVEDHIKENAYTPFECCC